MTCKIVRFLLYLCNVLRLFTTSSYNVVKLTLTKRKKKRKLKKFYLRAIKNSKRKRNFIWQIRNSRGFFLNSTICGVTTETVFRVCSMNCSVCTTFVCLRQTTKSNFRSEVKVERKKNLNCKILFEKLISEAEFCFVHYSHKQKNWTEQFLARFTDKLQ